MPELRMSDQPICDFCSEPKWARRFHCQDFIMDVTPGFPRYDSKGDWLACSVCGSLIDAENWDGLVQRAVDVFSEKYNMPRRILADTVRRSHNLFRQNYRKAER